MAQQGRGRFIVFEGIDGSGKSTAIRAVAAAQAEAGMDVWQTAEETESYLGQAVRRSIADKARAEATALLFVADRLVHAEAIEAALAAGRTVLCDRFLHSTLAYQAAAGCDPAWLERLHDPLAVRPDHVLLFDVDPDEAMQRIAGRGAAAPYEKSEFLAKVRAEYHALAEASPEWFTVIDASQAPEAVAAAAVAAVAKVNSASSSASP